VEPIPQHTPHRQEPVGRVAHSSRLLAWVGQVDRWKYPALDRLPEPASDSNPHPPCQFRYWIHPAALSPKTIAPPWTLC